jgi:polyribonucleotide nucleotidyltransferase
MEDSELDLVVAGTNDAVLMVESEAKELPEDVMLGAVMFGHKGFQPVIDAIIQLAEKCAKEPRDFQPEDLSELYDAVTAWSAMIWPRPTRSPPRWNARTPWAKPATR